MASQFRRLAAVLLSTTVLAWPALAQAQPGTGDDAPVYLEADSLEDIENGQGYIARGDVRAQQGERTLFADEIEYYPELNRVIARGNVVIHGQGPHPQYAEEVELDSELSSGIAMGFATMLENDGRLAAATAIRAENGDVELSDAYYTACPLCEDGTGSPTWRIRAGQVIQDTEDQMMYYRDAQLEVMGIPVLYAPVFAHPDPSSERRSGFLLPKVGQSSRLGFVYQQPYLWSISPSQDLVVAPRYMGNVNPLLYAEYRKRFWSGEINLEGSFTQEYEIDADGHRDIDSGNEGRWHLFGNGHFNISENWRWGFGAERASYDLYLRRYDFEESEAGGYAPIEAPSRTLVSQIYVEGRTRNSYTSLISATYQTLIDRDNNDTLPVLLPVAEHRSVWTAPQDWGRVQFGASAAVLDREDGSDYRRVSSEIDWSARWITPQGIVVEPTVYGRVDSYDLDDLDVATYGVASDSFTRDVGLIGMEASWPLVRPGDHVDLVIEPLVSTTLASDDPVRSQILNEDSLSVDLDEYGLIDMTRAPGLDVWEEGHWVTAGVRTTANWGSNGSARFFVGQGERINGNATFSEESGLFEDRTDLITSTEINWDAFSIEMQARLDQDDYDINRLDFSAGYQGDRFGAEMRFTEISDEASLRPESRELRASYSVQLNDHWQLIGDAIQDLDEELLRRNQVAFRYEDDCTRFDIIYRLEDSTSARIGRSESIGFEFTLFTLGGVREN